MSGVRLERTHFAFPAPDAVSDATAKLAEAVIDAAVEMREAIKLGSFTEACQAAATFDRALAALRKK